MVIGTMRLFGGHSDVMLGVTDTICGGVVSLTVTVAVVDEGA